MNEKPQSSTQNMSLVSNFPEDLISGILLRLPVRSLVRFKCVCKSWLSLISDPEFGKSHFDLAASPTHRCLTKAHDYEIESIDIDASPHNVVNLKFPLPLYDDDGNCAEFVGSCRGFILVSYPFGDVIVWNPSTGLHRSISTGLHRSIAGDELGDMIAPYQTGFGYDRSTDDYLFVLMEVKEYPDSVAIDHPTTIRIFSMKTNSWFDLEVSYAQYVDKCCDHMNIGYFLNDALHWLVTSYETKLNVIIAFDLVERTLSEIALSQTLARKIKSKEYYLRVLGECLSLCYPGDGASTAEIWMMKDYRAQSSWTKLFVFSTCNIPCNVIYPICFTFTKQGDTSCSYGDVILVLLNDKGWLLLDQSKSYIDRERILHCGLYRESLLSLPNVFEETREDDPLAFPWRRQVQITNSI